MSEIINNSEQRIETLKSVIRGIHAGEDVSAVKTRLSGLVQITTGSEIAAMEQELIREGMPIEEIKAMCDLHSQVVREMVRPAAPLHVPPGHPVDLFQQENTAIAGTVARMRDILGKLGGLGAGDDPAPLLAEWRKTLDELLEIEKHYARKENLLFPYLERHGITGPSKVMWAKDDDVRALLRALRAALGEKNDTLEKWQFVAEQVAEPLLGQIVEMVFKEENILLPMSLDKLAPEEWVAIHRETPRFGFCLVGPRMGYGATLPDAGTPTPLGESAGHISFSAGALRPDEISGIFSALPVDLTFVDRDDRVAFFSEGPDRVFARPKAVIGRKVQMCHPPASVHVVEQILGDFRSGRQHVAEFWINFQGKLVHIRYFAVRDDRGEYLGTLEVTQNLSPLRALSGERRLLQYEEGNVPNTPSDSAAARPPGDPFVRATIDGDSILARGEHPLGAVARAVQDLRQGEVVLLAVSFRPAPLIDHFVAQGCAVSALQDGARWQIRIGPRP